MKTKKKCIDIKDDDGEIIGKHCVEELFEEEVSHCCRGVVLYGICRTCKEECETIIVEI